MANIDQNLSDCLLHSNNIANHNRAHKSKVTRIFAFVVVCLALTQIMQGSSDASDDKEGSAGGVSVLSSAPPAASTGVPGPGALP